MCRTSLGRRRGIGLGLANQAKLTGTGTWTNRKDTNESRPDLLELSPRPKGIKINNKEFNGIGVD